MAPSTTNSREQHKVVRQCKPKTELPQSVSGKSPKLNSPHREIHHRNVFQEMKPLLANYFSMDFIRAYNHQWHLRHTVPAHISRLIQAHLAKQLN